MKKDQHINHLLDIMEEYTNTASGKTGKKTIKLSKAETLDSTWRQCLFLQLLENGIGGETCVNKNVL